VLPDVVRRFLEQRVDDAEQLEIILLLHHHQDRSWSAVDVATTLGLGSRRVEQQLEALGSRGLFDVRLGGDVRYRFRPVNDEVSAAARQLAECYRERRADVVAFVASRGARPLRDFADAFHLNRNHRKRDA
jgi:hypothetical protein